MRVIRVLDKPRGVVPRIHLADGRVLVYAVLDYTLKVDRLKRIEQFDRWDQERVREFGRELGGEAVAVEPGPNILFDATVRSDGGIFHDVETGSRYRANDASAVRILEAALEGRVRHERGLITARFEFRWPGRTLSLYLHDVQSGETADAPAPGEAPADAPDLSDFIRTLNP